MGSTFVSQIPHDAMVEFSPSDFSPDEMGSVGSVTDKNKALVEYAGANISDKMFVSKYAVALPSKRQLENFIKSELKNLK